MKIRLFFLAFASLLYASGCLTVYAIMQWTGPSRDMPIKPAEYHWSQVDKYNEVISNKSNMKIEAVNGHSLLYVTHPFDVRDHLYALEKLNEIRYASFIFPNVPAVDRFNKIWMTWPINRRENGIVVMEGNTDYLSFTIQGQQPLHLKLWYVPGAEHEVQNLIDRLESAVLE